jgi:hypothetical protein
MWTSDDTTAERSAEQLNAARRATPELSARRDAELREQTAKDWFRSEVVRFRRHHQASAPANCSEPAEWINCANWSARLADLTVCATAADRGLVSWSIAKAMFDRMEGESSSIEALVSRAVADHYASMARAS